MEYRNIKASIDTEDYRVVSTHHVMDGRSFEVNLENVFHDNKNARISFKKVLVTRYTPLKICLSEYCEDLNCYVKNHPGFMDSYSGIMELVDCDELKNKTTFAKSHGYKHYLIMTEDEYIEVLAIEDPLVDIFNTDE